MASEGWWEQAACQGVDPDAFFPDSGKPPQEARQACAICTVTSECLQYALENGERHGVWGGTSEQERRRLLARTAGSIPAVVAAAAGTRA